MDTLTVINKYNGQTLDLGSRDCLTMLFEIRGDATLAEQCKGRYKTMIGALRRLPSTSGFDTLESYMEGWETIAPGFVQDGDIIIAEGRHCYVYYQAHIFGVFDENTFKWKPVDLPIDIKNSVIFRAP